MSEFLYKKLNEEERKEIDLEAKRIMNSFGKKLELVHNLPKDSGILRGDGLRKDGGNLFSDKNFKKKILDNASKKNKDFIIAEKKSW